LKIKKSLLLILVVTLLLGFGFLPGNYFVSASDPVQPIQVDFPSPLGTSATSLPLRITIPNPLIFGYPRVPTELRVSIAGYRRSSLLIPLLINVDLNNPVSLSRYLNNPIEINVDFPLPIRKEGFYRVTVDVKCLYGPNYITTYWYSYTANYPLQIVPERIHIVSVIQKGNMIKAMGYSFSQAVINDFLGRGISFRFRVVISDNTILYEEPAAVVGVAFDSSELTSFWIEKEKNRLLEEYRFLLTQFSGKSGKLEVIFERGTGGNWRWCFSNQPESWVEEHGVLIKAALPTANGVPYFPGLSKIEWPGYIWNPEGEFQLEEVPVGIP